MGKKNIHIVPSSGRWAIKKGSSERASELFITQKKAIKAGRVIARRDKAELFIHARNGKIRERDSYGSDPYPPKG